jgi:hypothetical protein
MTTLILKEETSDRLVFVENPDNHKGSIFSFWKDKTKKFNGETSIVLDLNYKRINHTKTIQQRPDEQTNLPIDQVRQITIFSADYSPMPENQWPSEMVFTLLDGSSFVFNSGRRDEIKSLAEKIAGLINKSVEEKFVSSPKDFPN